MYHQELYSPRILLGAKCTSMISGVVWCCNLTIWTTIFHWAIYHIDENWNYLCTFISFKMKNVILCAIYLYLWILIMHYSSLYLILLSETLVTNCNETKILSETLVTNCNETKIIIKNRMSPNQIPVTDIETREWMSRDINKGLDTNRIY